MDNPLLLIPEVKELHDLLRPWLAKHRERHDLELIVSQVVQMLRDSPDDGTVLMRRMTSTWLYCFGEDNVFGCSKLEVLRSEGNFALVRRDGYMKVVNKGQQVYVPTGYFLLEVLAAAPSPAVRILREEVPRNRHRPTVTSLIEDLELRAREARQQGAVPKLVQVR
jgi:hypothetical protein